MNAGLLLVIVIAVASGGARSERFYQGGATYHGSIPSPSLPVFHSWSFARGVPIGFSLGGVAGHPANGATEITTSSAANAVTLLSSALDLLPGRYELVVRGQIAHGGVALQALPRNRTQPTTQALYWTGQTRAGSTSLTLKFDLSAPTVERLALANWSQGGSSRLRLERIELRWMPPHSVKRWAFSSGVPAGWTVEPGTSVARRGGGISVTTSPTAATYQLDNPNVALGRGRYELIATGLISSGGMDVGVVDVPTDTWIRQVTVSTKGHSRAIPVVPFTLSSPTVVKIAFANFTNPPASSTWQITRVALRKLAARPH